MLNNLGLLDLEMPLSDEPNLGLWTVSIVENDASSSWSEITNFEVRKYVLPKFEVSIDHFKKIRFDEAKMNVTVCGQYSYGKGVQGTYTLKSATSKFSYTSYRREEYKQVAMLSAGVKGCFTFEISPEELGIGDKNYIGAVEFEASVTESDTGITANASSSVDVTHTAMEIEVEEVGYYKPGFPIDIKASVRSIRGVPVAGEKLEVMLEQNDEQLFRTIIATDQTGAVLVRFDPDTCTRCGDKSKRNKKPESLRLTVRPEKFTPDYSLPHFKQLHNPQIIRYLSPWISGQNSYIQIFRDVAGPARLKCGQTAKLQVRYRTGEALTDSDSVYFQFQSRSSVVNSGHFNVDSDGQVVSRIPTRVRLVSTKKVDLELVKAELNAETGKKSARSNKAFCFFANCC